MDTSREDADREREWAAFYAHTYWREPRNAWHFLNRDLKKAFKRQYRKEKEMFSSNTNIEKYAPSCFAGVAEAPSLNCLATLNPLQEVTTLWPPAQKQRNKKMYIEMNDGTPRTEIMLQRSYLNDRLEEIYTEKAVEAQQFFGMVDDESPKTAKEYVQRIKDGKYTITKGREDDVYYNPAHYIKWRDPAKTENKPAFYAFEKRLDATKSTIEDTIMISDAATGLKAVQEMKNITIQ